MLEKGLFLRRFVINTAESLNVVPKSLFINRLSLLLFVYYCMFIRKFKQKSKNNSEYIYHRLVESVRTNNGPRQKIILNLGQLNIAEEKWPKLVSRIEDNLKGQVPLFTEDAEIESLAFYYCQKIIQKNNGDNPQLPAIDVQLKSIKVSKSRTIGAEQVGLTYLKYLQLDQYLSELGFTKRQKHLAILTILGRLIHPTSELATLYWAKNLSSLGELLVDDFEHISKNSLYRISDLLYRHKEKIETFLNSKERDLFNLCEHIILYDLTNTYFEGLAEDNPKAKFGKSKEKRSDCRLVTLGLVIDEHGFPKRSKIFSGNQSDPKTLKEMILTLSESRENKDKPITVVIDAGIATEENIQMLKDSNICYVVVSRKRKYDIPSKEKEVVTIREDDKEKIKVSFVDNESDRVLYVHSIRKEYKERSIKNRFEQLFEENLNYLSEGLDKKYRIKRYEKVLESIGRLKERYSYVSSYYDIEVEREGNLAVSLEYTRKKERQLNNKYSGIYYLRTNRKELTEKEIWDIYNLIRKVEYSFRCLKSDLGIRPIYHQKEERSDSHIFITILAYHLLNSIEYRLRANGDSHSWHKVRTILSSHTRVTVAQRDRENNKYNVRISLEPNDEQSDIYKKLLVNEMMLPAKLVPD